MLKIVLNLLFSYQRCEALETKENYTDEELEHFESLTGRFARLSDLLIQKIFRLIDQIDLEDQGTVKDRNYCPLLFNSVERVHQYCERYSA